LDDSNLLELKIIIVSLFYIIKKNYINIRIINKLKLNYII
jgi:hypothetical protein